MDKVKTVALVAHDNRKPDLIEWLNYNADKLANLSQYINRDIY